MGMMNLEIIANFSKQSDPVQQKNVLNYFESLKTNPNGWRLCSETLSTLAVSDETSIFFCLQVIEHYVRSGYTIDTIENNLELKRYILQWFDSALFQSNVLQNKYAYIVNSIFVIDFSRGRWDCFFKDFLHRCSEEIKYCLFLRILIQINLDIADREFPRTDKELKRNTYIKDVMRETCLLDLAQFWFGILSVYKNLAPQTVLLCLETIGAYVSWVDINLITNASTMSSLFLLFSEEQYRCGVTDCFIEILRKGMDSRAKTQIIEDFMNIECIKSTIEAIRERRHLTDQVFVEKFANLINTIGIELIEAYKKEATPAKNKSGSLIPQGLNGTGKDILAIQVISSSIESKYNLLCRFLDFKNLNICYKVHSFTKEYIQWFRAGCKERGPEMATAIEEKTIQLLTIIIERTKYPTDSNYEDDFFEDYRKSSKILFDNLVMLSPKTVFTFTCDKLVGPTLIACKSSASSVSFADLEVALYYFCMIGENSQLVAENSKTIEELIHLLVTNSISSYANSIIQSFYFDLLVRYEKFVNINLSFLFSEVLVSFLDERGLCNIDYKIRSKVCKMFKKFLVRTKYNCLETYVEDILKRLQELIKPDVAFDDVDELNELGIEDLANSEWLVHRESLDDKTCISTSDQLQIYEIITFLVVSNPTYEIEQKKKMMENLLQTVWTNFEKLFEEIGQLTSALGQNGIVASGGKSCLVEKRVVRVLHLAHCINSISATTRSFTNVCTMKTIGIQEGYLRSFELFLKTYTMNTDERSQAILQSSVRQYLHRLIVCLNEEDVVPALPNSIQTLFFSSPEMSARAVLEFIPLLQQIVTKFKASWLFQRDLSPFIAQIFGPMVVNFFKLIVAAVSEVEKVQLQKTYYSFLHIIITNQLLPNFFALDPQLVEQTCGSLIDGLVNLSDGNQMSIQIVSSLIELHADENRPINGSWFVSYIYKSLLPALFLVGSRNARQVGLVTDVIQCLRRAHRLLGEELCAYLRFQLIPDHFKSVSNGDELIGLLLMADLKTSMPTFKQVLPQFT